MSSGDFYTWMFVFLRIGAFLLVLPFFSATNFPSATRLALAILTSFLVSLSLPQFVPNDTSMVTVIGLMFMEVGVGLVLGLVSRMVFYAADLAGNIISTEMGLNLGAILNPVTQTSSVIPGTILFFLAAVVMLTLDLHHWVLVGFQRTYLVLPIGGAGLNDLLFVDVVRHTSRIFIVALQISAPVIAVSIIVMLVFALLSRAVPQANVFILSFSFRIFGCLAVFGFTLHLTAQHVMNYLHRLPDDLLRLAQYLGMG